MSPVVAPTAETIPTLTNFTPPTWLKHTPVYLLPYEHFDGRYAANNTDAKYLGYGLAQWRGDGDPYALSIKSWRHTDERWSRQSEEIPLPRHVDMTILLAHILAQRDSDMVELPAATFEHQSEAIELRSLTELPEGCEQDKELCRVRLRKLREVLNQLQI